MAQPNIFIVDGVDRLGKTTLIRNLQDRLGPFVVVHSGKPPVLERFMNKSINSLSLDLDATAEQRAQAVFQEEYFKQTMLMIQHNTDVKIIFDRLHLGEMVYSPLYRKVVPNAVMEFEKLCARPHGVQSLGGGFTKTRLILLTEDFSKSRHFVSDGESFNDAAREEEQQAFLKAYQASCIEDKRIINVTGADGNFKPELEILLEALI